MTSKQIKTKRSITETDWQAVKRRLEEVNHSIENLDSPDENRQRQILRERAAALARMGTRAQPAGQAAHVIEVLEFRSAGEKYAFETEYVAQVYPICPITPVPGTPNFVVGIIPAQGDVLSIIDLRLMLNLPISRLEEPTSFIVIQSQTMEFGILAEEILGVETYSMDELEQELPTLADTANTYLKGVSPGRTAILDAGQLLSDSRLIVEIN